MATLPLEQVTQRTRTADVSITFDNREASPGEKLWLSTRTGFDSIVDTKSVVTNQKDRQVMEDRINAAGATAYPATNLNTKYGYGDTYVPE